VRVLLGLSTETKVFSALVLLVGAIVIAVVAYDIYLHPPDPEPAGTARIEIRGTEGIDFRGTVGTASEANEHVIEGSTPVTFTTPYRSSDYVTADISPAKLEGGQGTLKVEIKKVIKGKDKTVEAGQTEPSEGPLGGNVFLIWKPS